MKYALRLHFYSTFENYLWHINTLILCNGIEWNVVIVGIYFTRLEAVFHLVYPLLWRNKINQIRGEISFSFDIWKLLVADGGGRPAASAGGAARPAAGGGCDNGVPTLAAAADSERWTSAAAISHFAWTQVPPCDCIGHVIYTSYVSVWISKYIAAYDLVEIAFSFDIWKLLVAYKQLILCNGIEWNVVIVGIYFTCLEAVFHFTYTLFWRT